jgi:redox-sensitive bicupin YhaK (pirin superfamily)
MTVLPDAEPACRDIGGEHPLDVVVEARPRPVGTLTVGRALPSLRRRAVGPFVFLDHFGPVEQNPGEGFDVAPHPHIGLSTVTYLLSGSNLHRDSIGSVARNRAGDLNVMTAGRGVVHSERADADFRARGGTLHGLQLWLGLPIAHEEDAPTFESHGEETLPRGRPGAGVEARVVLGALFGLVSPARHLSEPLLVELRAAKGACVSFPADVPERAVFVVEGTVCIGDEELAPNHLGVLRAGTSARVTARTDSQFFFLGGPPLDGPRHLDWNFVSSSKDRLARAVLDWKERRFPSIPDDGVDFVPYPDPRHPRPRS